MMTAKSDDSVRDAPRPTPESDLANRLRAHPRFKKSEDAAGRGTVIVGVQQVKQEEPK